MTTKLVGDLEVDEEALLRRKGWILERAGWLLMACIALLAGLGLFGDGPLSRASVSDPGGTLRVEYERFARHESAAVLRVLVPAGKTATDRTSLEIDAGWMRRVGIDRIVPQPEKEEGVAGGIAYVFRTPAGPAAREISFHVTMEDVGRLSGRVTLDGRTSVRFSQFIYP